MANWYVYSGAAGAGIGTDWANAYTTLKAAAEAAGTAAGDSIWVAHDHAETTASALSITIKAGYFRIICVDRAGSVPPVAADVRATATITTTGASVLTLTCATSSFHYVEGITFNCATGAVTSGMTICAGAVSMGYFKNCSFRRLATTGAASNQAIIIGGARNRVFWENCSVLMSSAAGQEGLMPMGFFEWRGGSVIGSGPVNLFAPGNTNWSDIRMYGVDLTGVTPALIFGASSEPGPRLLVNCKFKAGAAVAASGAFPSSAFTVINCDSGDTNYLSTKLTETAAQTVETVIVRSGGATDGTTPISWKIVTTALPKITWPYDSLPITVWSDTIGAKTVSLYGYWDNASVPTNAQIWMVAEYLGTSGFPISSFVSSGPATVLTAGSNIPSDTSTWGGGDTTTRFKMSVSLTTAEKGPITVRVFVAAASSTFYIDPKIEVV